MKLWRATESTFGLQSDPAGQVIYLSKNRFTKETFKLLNKNLNSVTTQTNFNKTTLNKEMKDFYRRIKLKAHFKNPDNKARFADGDIFIKPTNKTWVPNNNHYNIETFIEATRNEINNEIKNTKRNNYSNLSVKEQNALQELQSRDDIVTTEPDKGGAVVILDVEDYIKEAERQLHNTENY